MTLPQLVATQNLAIFELTDTFLVLKALEKTLDLSSLKFSPPDINYFNKYPSVSRVSNLLFLEKNHEEGM